MRLNDIAIQVALDEAEVVLQQGIGGNPAHLGTAMLNMLRCQVELVKREQEKGETPSLDPQP
jgi:hypothetical protein